VGGAPEEDLGSSTTVVDRTDVGVNVVGEDVFVPTWNVHGWVGRAVPCTEMAAHRDACHLGGALKGMFDDVVGLIEEIRTELVIIRVDFVDGMIEYEVFEKPLVVEEVDRVVRVVSDA
jgi:hypothetical protein